MNNEADFESYFYLSTNKLIITVFEKNNKKNIFNDEVVLKDNDNNKDDDEIIDYLEIENFLEKNIFKIEKITKTFLNEVYLIIDHQDSLPINISLKYNNEGNLLKKRNVDYLLKDAKQQINRYYLDRSAAHIIINNYILDKVNYSYLPENLSCDNFSLEIKFICFSKKIIKEIEDIFHKQHIFINKVICAKYAKEFFNYEKIDICEMALNICEGCNKKEVILIPKIEEKKGFFERFFNLFG